MPAAPRISRFAEIARTARATHAFAPPEPPRPRHRLHTVGFCFVLGALPTKRLKKVDKTPKKCYTIRWFDMYKAISRAKR